MFKRALPIIFCLCFIISLSPAAAQESSPVDWVPADFAGVVRLRVDSENTLLGLNMSAFIASFLQPTRFTFEAIQSLDVLIPLTQLDSEGATFNQNISPWLKDEIVLAYKAFDNGLEVDSGGILMILPTRDALQSASSFSQILQSQDLLEKETYRGLTLYEADKSTIAFSPTAVIIGQTDAVKSVLDLQAGIGERLAAGEAYQAVQSATSGNALVSAYINGNEAMRAFSVLVTGDESSMPMLRALGEALSAQRGAASFEQVILGDSLDGVGLTLQPDMLRLRTMRATVTLYDADKPEPVAVSEFNPAVLEMIPQNAMIVHDGADAVGAIYDTLYALSLTNFAGEILAAFPVISSATSTNELIDKPSADNLLAAVEGVLQAFDRYGDFDLQGDLLQYLSGSYVVALMPRPNNPTPLNTPFDMLVIVEAKDGQAALDGLAKLTRAALGLDELVSKTVDNIEVSIVPAEPAVEPALTMGVVDDMLVIGTGSALEAALAAQRGDNRLVSRPRWEAISRDGIPHLYVDIPAIYTTFFPQAGGQVMRQISQLGAKAAYLGAGLYQIDLVVTLPGGL